MLPVPPQRTHETEPLWPERTKSIRLEMASQIRTVASFEAEARRGRPGVWRWYGSQLRLLTHLVWPFRGEPRGWPVFGSHSRTVLSILPVAIMSPSGE